MKNIYQNIKVKHFLGFVIFLLLAVSTLSKITYLFRNTGYDRNHIVGIKSEEKNIDVVYIGGSASFIFWQPVKAFGDYGFTSYCLGSNSLVAESILPLLKYAEKYTQPQLYIIDSRPFQYYTNNLHDSGVRNTSDSMDLTNANRYELISSYLKNRNADKPTDIASYYIDIAKYHTNYDNLKSDKAWNFINNNGTSRFKGGEFEYPDQWAYMDKPIGFITDKKKNLLPDARDELEKILAYCDEKKLNVLFVVSPYCITEEHYELYNTVCDEVSDHGYQFINSNDYLDLMGMDFARDYYDKSHVNAYGAEKYTAFLGDQIIQKYNLPDHREDANYSDWNESLHEFELFSEEMKEAVDDIVSAANYAIKKGEEIRNTVEFCEWCALVKDYHYSLLFVGNGNEIESNSELDQSMLKYLGLDRDEFVGNEKLVKVLADDRHNIAVSSEMDDYIVTTEIGQVRVKSDATIDGNTCSIEIEGKECSRQSREGVNVVCFDNYYRTIIDSVTLKCIDGKIQIIR